MIINRNTAYNLKHYSVYIGIVAYVAMLVTGEVFMGALGKLIAEVLRIPYFLHTDARDMAALSCFFILASSIAIGGYLL